MVLDLAAEAPGSGGKVKLLCKVLGHLHPSGAQVFASVEQREADGAWLAVRGWCKRCDERLLLGSLWVQDYTVCTLADAGKRESANAAISGAKPSEPNVQLERRF